MNDTVRKYMNDTVRSRLFPSKYNDNVNFILLIIFLGIFFISCFLLGYPSLGRNPHIISLGKISSIFSLAGIGTVIFSGFFKSIGIFKDDRTVLAGAAAVFFIFVALLYFAFSKINETDTKIQIERDKKIEELRSDLLSERDKYTKLFNEKEKLRNEIDEFKSEIITLQNTLVATSKTATENIERRSILELVSENIYSNSSNKSQFMGINSVVLFCDTDLTFLSQSELYARGSNSPEEKITSDNSGRFLLTRTLSNEPVTFKNNQHRKIFNLRYDKGTIYLDIESENINQLCLYDTNPQFEASKRLDKVGL